MTFSSWISSPSFTSASSNDVGPRAANGLLTVLVARHRLEHEEVVAALLVEVLQLGVAGYRVACADGLAPDELLAAVEHLHQVDADLAVEDRRPHRAGGVDDREHRRRHDVAEPGLARGVPIAVDTRALSHRVRVLADLLEPDLVRERRPGLPLQAL